MHSITTEIPVYVETDRNQVAKRTILKNQQLSLNRPLDLLGLELVLSCSLDARA